MRLVLLDASVEKIPEVSNISTFLVTTEKLLASLAKTDHETTRKFVSEIFTEETSSLKFEVCIQPCIPTTTTMDSLKISIYPTSSRSDAMRRMMDRFHDVTLSIDLATMGSLIHDTCWLSASGIRMNPDNFIWSGCDGVYDKRHLGYSPCRMRITAHIPDDVIPSVYLSPGEKIHILLSGESYFDEETLSDVVLIAGNGAMIQCHRQLIIASSSILQERLNTGKKTGKIFVNMADISEKGVKAIVRYLYCNNLDEPWNDAEIAYELLCAAQTYGMPRLMASLIKQLMESWLWKPGMERVNEPKDLRVKIAFKIYMFAKRVDAASVLKGKMLHFLIAKMDKLDSLPEYIELFQEYPDVAKDVCRDLVNASMN